MRFACGALFGPILALMLFWWILLDITLTWLVGLGAAVFFGVAAALRGDRFWHFLLGMFLWW
jgi:hypothetical protein